MYRSGRERRRAAITAGASFVAGTLLITTAAVGGMVTSQQAGTSPVSSTTATRAINGATTGKSAGTEQGAATGIAAGTATSACLDPVTGKPGPHLSDPSRSALLIGDSQSSGAAGVSGERTWTQAGLRGAGYDVQFLGAGGTGFVATNTSGGSNYGAALEQGQWVMPCDSPALIMVEGGGNDATQGASDAQILAGADALVSKLSAYYPSSKIVLIGTLAKDAANGGGRRTAVDHLLGTYAADNSIEFVSTGDWLTRFQADHLMADAVHLTQAGHDRLAAVLTSQLESRHLTPGQLTPSN